MLIRISASPSGPLSVVPRFPDANLAILEGYNGIGKTLAVRILQLCTGTMPYALDSPAWESLREGLNKIEVEMTGLHGAERVLWVADSAEWEPGDGPVPRTEWFQSITIDGQPASLDDVRRLVTVVRLAGDEDLTETFASQAETHAAAVQRWTVRHASPEHGPLKELEDLAGVGDDLLSTIQIPEFAQLRVEADQAGRNLGDKRAVVAQLQGRRDQVNEALDFRRRINDVRTEAPGLQREIEKIDRSISERQAELERAQEEITSLATRVGRSEALGRELKNAERTLLRNIDNLEGAWSRVAAQAVELDIEADAGVARACVEELIQQEQRLVDQHREQHKAPAMVQLLATLTGELQAAQSIGLDDQIAVEDADSGTELSVSQTRAGMVKRRSYLEEQPPPPKAVETLGELKRVRDRKEHIEVLLAALAEIERFERLVSRNEERVRTALQEGAGGEAADELRRAANRRFKCDQALRDLAVRRAVLAQRLGPQVGSTTEEALKGQLARLLNVLGLPEDRLETESTALETQLTDAEAALAVAADTARDWQQKVAQANASIRRAVELLDSDDRLTWLRESLKPRRAFSGDVDDLHEDLATAQRIVNEILERLGNHRNQLNAVEMALRGTARQLRGQTVDAFEYVEQVQRWLASEYSNWFNDRRVRRELLKNADDDQDVTVDLGTQRVGWSEDHRRRSRPLGAFSSGEQAFAYTRARLAVLEDTGLSVKNRLIVLDEFGAFISHHLLQGLLEYLQEWTSARDSDRVLLILPLSRDYPQMAQNAIGARAEQYAALARDVEDHGYVTRLIVR